MRLSLGDVLDQPGLGLRLRTGGEAARAAPVDGAHSVDHLRDPVRWLQDHWIMLTTGSQLRGRAATQRRLVAELAEGRITALGFGVGISHVHVPRALLEEAERRAFPVFEVPLETPFREIISVVNRSALSGDLQVLRRVTQLQRHLLDARSELTPEQALIERLASALGGAEVVYVGAAGETLAVTGADLTWSAAALAGATAGPREFEHAGRRGVVMAVDDAGAAVGRLAALPDAGALPRELARPLVRVAGEMLGLVAATRVSAARGRRERRARLGARLARLAGGEADAGLGAALAAEGLDFTRPCLVALVAAAEDDAAARETALARVEGALADQGVDFVCGPRTGQVIVLAQDDLAGLDGPPALDGLRAGVSEPVERLEELPDAVEQAALALTVALWGGDGAALQRHETLEPSVALLGGSSRTRERLVGALDPLAAEPRLRAAVVAYLDAGLDVGRAAHALGLHRNSLRYRLDRAEDLLGGSLRSPGTLATVHLALLAERLRLATAPR